MRARVVALAFVCVIAAEVAAAEPQTWLIPPVDGPIGARFVQPDGRYGRGHRGIDYLVPPGTAVRAAAPGAVVFAGQVAGRLAVTIEHPDGSLTSYTWLSEVLVEPGAQVRAGTWIGRSGYAHDGLAGLHLSVRREGRYLDPEALIGELDLSGAVFLVGDDDRPGSCEPGRNLTSAPAPPNGNIAVVIGGLSSRTDRGTYPAVVRTAALLGYPAERTYVFSYAGVDAGDLHVPYGPRATYGDLRAGAARLGELLAAIAARHPGSDIDLIAHSQGGLVARAYLALQAESWDLRAPRVANLVTFATPHQGAPLADEVGDIDRTLTGALALEGAGELLGDAWPDPDDPVVAQLATGSSLIKGLAREDVAFGTRTLTLAGGADAAVPAARASFEGARHHVVAPSGLLDHSAVLTSGAALATAYDFLRGRPDTCHGLWDKAGPLLGWAAETGERAIGKVFEKVDDVLLEGAGKLVKRLWRRP